MHITKSKQIRPKLVHLPTPTQKLNSGFPIIKSQEIDSGLVSFKMILQALQSEPFRFKFH